MSPVHISDTPQQNVVMLGNGLIDIGVVLVTVFRLLSLVVGEWELFYEHDGWLGIVGDIVYLSDKCL